MAQGFRRQSGRQRVLYVGGGHAPLQPGGCRRCEAAYVALGEEEPGRERAEPGQEVGGGAVGWAVARPRTRLRSGGVLGWGRWFGLLGLRRQFEAGRGGVCGGATIRVLRDVVRDRAGHDPPGRQALLDPGQIPVRLQLPQSGGDTRLPFGELRGEGLDADQGSVREGLDVRREADRGQGEVGMLGEVVSDDGELLGLMFVHVTNSESGAAGSVRSAGTGARGSARVLLSHREALFFLGDQALVRDCRPGGGRFVWSAVA